MILRPLLLLILCTHVVAQDELTPGKTMTFRLIPGEEKELKRWVTIPHLLVLFCDLFIIYGAVQVWVDAS